MAALSGTELLHLAGLVTTLLWSLDDKLTIFHRPPPLLLLPYYGDLVVTAVRTGDRWHCCHITTSRHMISQSQYANWNNCFVTLTYELTYWTSWRVFVSGWCDDTHQPRVQTTTCSHDDEGTPPCRTLHSDVTQNTTLPLFTARWTISTQGQVSKEFPT